MAYSDLLAQRPFQPQPSLGDLGAMAGNPYAEILQGILGDMQAFSMYRASQGAQGGFYAPHGGHMGAQPGGGQRPATAAYNAAEEQHRGY